MKPPIDFSKFPEIENNSAISTLIEIVEQQSVTIQQQGEVIQLLRDEIARLKGQTTEIFYFSTKTVPSHEGLKTFALSNLNHLPDFLSCYMKTG